MYRDRVQELIRLDVIEISAAIIKDIGHIIT